MDGNNKQIPNPNVVISASATVKKPISMRYQHKYIKPHQSEYIPENMDGYDPHHSPLYQFSYLPKFYQSLRDQLSEENVGWMETVKQSPCYPKFLIIGTQKGGTSSLNSWLKIAQHEWRKSNTSWVSVPRWEKELNVFSERLPFYLAHKALLENERHLGDYRRPMWIPERANSALDIFRWYQAQFRGGRGDSISNFSRSLVGNCLNVEDIRGEASPNYLSSPYAPFLAGMFLPNSRIIVSLRNPFDRLLSAFNMKWQVRTCGNLAWKRSDCYNTIMSRDSTDILDMAQNFVNEFRDEILGELTSLEDCFKRFKKPFIHGTTLDSLFELTRMRCMFSEDISPQDTISMQNVGDLYVALEDRSFLARSLYANQMLLWKYFFPDSSKWMILDSSKFEESPLEVLNEIGKFIGLGSSLAPLEMPKEDPNRHVRSYVLKDLEFKYKRAKQNSSFSIRYQAIMKSFNSLKSRVCLFLDDRNQELYQVLLSEFFVSPGEIEQLKNSFICK